MEDKKVKYTPSWRNIIVGATLGTLISIPLMLGKHYDRHNLDTIKFSDTTYQTQLMKPELKSTDYKYAKMTFCVLEKDSNTIPTVKLSQVDPLNKKTLDYRFTIQEGKSGRVLINLDDFMEKKNEINSREQERYDKAMKPINDVKADSVEKYNTRRSKALEKINEKVEKTYQTKIDSVNTYYDSLGNSIEEKYLQKDLDERVAETKLQRKDSLSVLDKLAGQVEHFKRDSIKQSYRLLLSNPKNKPKKDSLRTAESRAIAHADSFGIINEENANSYFDYRLFQMDVAKRHLEIKRSAAIAKVNEDKEKKIAESMKKQFPN